MTTKGGRYVQGGGCLTVGVAGLIQGGGFGSFSKAFGTAGRHPPRGGDRHRRRRGEDRQRLLEPGSVLGAERRRRRVRRRHPPDAADARRFPTFVGGGVRDDQGGVRRRLSPPGRRGSSTSTARRSSTRIGASRSSLRRVGVPRYPMVFQGLDQQQAEAAWRPFLRLGRRRAAGLHVVIGTEDLGRCRRSTSGTPPCSGDAGLGDPDDRPGAPADNIFWAGNLDEAGVRLARLSIRLAARVAARTPTAGEARRRAVSRPRSTGACRLHFNKGLAGAPAEAIASGEGHARRIRRSPTPSRSASAGPANSPPIRALPDTSRTSRRRGATPPR